MSTKDPTIDDHELPPEYREDVPSEAELKTDTLPAPAEPAPGETLAERRHREAMESIRGALPLAREVSEMQRALDAGAIPDAGRRIARAAERAAALERLDIGINVIKAIPLPEPYNLAVDTFAEVMRRAIHELYPVAEAL